jgi:transcription initiation factor TFIID TATA-box-binding protein
MVNTTEPKKTIKIENVVASTAIGAKLDLNQILSVFEGAEYNKERFPGVVYRTKSPKPQRLFSAVARSFVLEQKVLQM